MKFWWRWLDDLNVGSIQPYSNHLTNIGTTLRDAKLHHPKRLCSSTNESEPSNSSSAIQPSNHLTNHLTNLYQPVPSNPDQSQPWVTRPETVRSERRSAGIGAGGARRGPLGRSLVARAMVRPWWPWVTMVWVKDGLNGAVLHGWPWWVNWWWSLDDSAMVFGGLNLMDNDGLNDVW